MTPPPQGMTEATWERIRRLRGDVRDRVIERACILHFEAGVPFPEADVLALEQEAGVPRTLPGFG